MYKGISKLIAKKRKPFTQELVDGWAYNDMKDLLPYYNESIKCILKSLESVGFYFEGIERVSPIEFYNAITKKKKNGYSDFESSKNSFFGVKFKSYYIDPKTKVRTDLNRPYLFLPYTNKYGDIFVRNALYSVQLVLSERRPSVDSSGKEAAIFMRSLSHKAKIFSDAFNLRRVCVNRDGALDRMEKSITLPCNRFYAAKRERQVGTRTPRPLLAWYVFAKYGFTYAMTHFAATEFAIDTISELAKDYPNENEWGLFENHYTPSTLEFNRGTIAPNLAIAIKVFNGEPVGLSYHYAGSLLYTMSLLGEDFDLTKIDDPDYWKIIIADFSISKKKSQTEDFILRQMKEHIQSVEEYADPWTLKRYNLVSIKVNDIYELFNYLIINYNEITRTFNPADLTGKELACKEFLLESLIRNANNFKFDLKNKGKISPKVIQTLLWKYFNSYVADKSVRDNNAIQEQTGTDNPFADYGLGIIRQTRSTVSRNSSRKKDDFNPNHPSGMIHISQAFVASYQHPTNPNPAGDGFLTPRVCLVNGRYTDIHDYDRDLYNYAKRKWIK